MLIRPAKDEMIFRTTLYERLHNWNFGTRPYSFAREDWDTFYRDYVEADPRERFYRYYYCETCGVFVGEIWWEKANDGIYDLHILVERDMRGCGYGTRMLEEVETEARRQNIHTFRIQLLPENPYEVFFLRRGFKTAGTDTTYLLHI